MVPWFGVSAECQSIGTIEHNASPYWQENGWPLNKDGSCCISSTSCQSIGTFMSLGGPRHGARVWCLGRVPKHRNQWQELEGLLFSPKNSQLVLILSFRSQGVVSYFIFPTCQIALDSEPRDTKPGHHGLDRPDSRRQYQIFSQTVISYTLLRRNH